MGYEARHEILQNVAQMSDASKQIHEMGLPSHHDSQKDWDLLLSLRELSKINKRSKVLDAGSGSKAVFANSARLLGYKRIFACDLQSSRINGVQSTIQDLTSTTYKNEQFQFIACHSVIEHGIDIEVFLREMFRIASPGAGLCISTDFWPEPEDHSDKYPYGVENPPMKLFNMFSMNDLVAQAKAIGWSVQDFPRNLQLTERPVSWPRMNASYTFIWSFLVKPL